MRKLLATLVAALFAAVTFVAYGADQPASGDQAQPQKPAKQSKKKQKHAKKQKSQGVEAGAPQAQGRGTPSGAAAAGGGAVEQGAPAAQGRGTPSGAAAGGAVTSPTPKGPGRGDNQ
ncbi:MAG TPA: hypothetical protein VMH32_19210 [Burkholderiales bacterium]|nr:hypothetical protein [Burkholderiales bacterium]